jgi:hypothetical protein
MSGEEMLALMNSQQASAMANPGLPQPWKVSGDRPGDAGFGTPETGDPATRIPRRILNDPRFNPDRNRPYRAGSRRAGLFNGWLGG